MTKTKRTKTKTIKVFRLNDCDWFAGADLESCIKCYFAEYLNEPDTPESRNDYNFDEAEELTDEQMDRLKFTDIEGEWGGRGGEYTFRQALENMIKAGVKFPSFFASTEF